MDCDGVDISLASKIQSDVKTTASAYCRVRSHGIEKPEKIMVILISQLFYLSPDRII